MPNDSVRYSHKENQKILVKLLQGVDCENKQAQLNGKISDLSKQVDKANLERDQAKKAVDTNKVERHNATANLVKQLGKGILFLGGTIAAVLILR